MLRPEQDAEIEAALAELRAGRQIGLPTETVYGLAADATDPQAVRGIFLIKGRPANHPLILHLAETSWLSRYCVEIPELAEKLADAFWPGPLTLVLRRSAKVPDEVTGGLQTVAVRVPAHPLALELLRRFDKPLAAPSANRFGAVSPTTRAHVCADLGDELRVVLEGGACDFGVESTIVDLTRGVPRILRPGGVTREQIEELLGMDLPVDDGKGPSAPGTLAAHYCPQARVCIVPRGELFSEALRLSTRGEKVGLLCSESPPQGLGVPSIVVGSHSREVARELYAAFRALDEQGCEKILTSLPLEDGMGAAVADRILRATVGGSKSQP